MKTSLPLPTEAQEGHTLVAYLRVKGYKFSHIPNETGGSLEARRRAVRMKQQGTSRGFPDYIIIKNNKLVFIELKRSKGGTITKEQQEWLGALAETGAECATCYGAESAIDFLERCV